MGEGGVWAGVRRETGAGEQNGVEGVQRECGEAAVRQGGDVGMGRPGNGAGPEERGARVEEPFTEGRRLGEAGGGGGEGRRRQDNGRRKSRSFG